MKSSRMGTVRRGILVAMLVAAFLTACGGDPVAVPNVVGYQLDDAHNQLKDSGFEKFDDIDVIGKRTPIMDSNWVVLGQSPTAGQQAKTGTKIRLEIGKISDKGIIDRLPAGSPVALRLGAAEQEARAQRDRADAAEKAKDKEFIEQIDEHARVMMNGVPKALEIRDTITANGTVSLDDITDIGKYTKLLDLYWEKFEGAPTALNPRADLVQEAIREFQKAAGMLKSAEGAAADGSLRRFTQIYDAAVKKYNEALKSLYAGSGIEPPTL